jgi:hypothetical protein
MTMSETESSILRKGYKKGGVTEVFPTHWMVNNWLFKEGEEEEAKLAHCMALVAEKNGMSANDLHHLFPAVLRMLKSEIPWSK